MLILSDSLIECIQEKASSIWLCNSNEQLQTATVRLMGARVEEDRKHITVYVPVQYGAEVIRNLATTDKITFLTAIIHTYVSYQVKGTYISQCACTEADIAYQWAYMDGFTDALAKQGLSKQKGIKAYYQQPSIAMRILAEEVYEQTPRKGTGEKVNVL